MSAPKDVGSKKFDIIIIGAGILGVCIAFWLSQLCDCTICIVDQEVREARHTSSRNTGVIHRPFYLDPEKKRVFASAAQKSYYMWYSLAKKYNSPWFQAGTLELAIRDADIRTLESYSNWASSNGMGEDEIAILDSRQVKEMEPEVNCLAAIFSKTDTSVDYGEFSTLIFRIAISNGVKFLGGHRVVKISETKDGATVTMQNDSGTRNINGEFLINVAGGSSLRFAHMLHLVKNLAEMHFRGDYWVVSEAFGAKIAHNIYTVARYKEFPFLDPHFIVRVNGTRQIGPNAALVSGPYAYGDKSSSSREFVKKLFERPLTPKLKLLTNRKFLSLAWGERKSSYSKDEMSKRVRKFIPSLSTKLVNGHGMAGIRSSLIDGNGFVPEAVQLEGEHSFHVLNYNSPGATGAPAFSSYLVKRMRERGFVNRLRINSRSERIWKFDVATDFDLLTKESNLNVSY